MVVIFSQTPNYLIGRGKRVRALSGPVKILGRPVHEARLECLRVGQADGPVVLGVEQRRAQERRVRQVGMVIWKGAELDHGEMLPQRISRGQNQKNPLMVGDLSDVEVALR